MTDRRSFPRLAPDRDCMQSDASRTADLPYSELMLLFENMISPFSYYRMVYDPSGSPADYEFLAVNSAFERETGLDRKQILGRRVLEVYPDTEDYWIQKLGDVARTGVPNSFVNYSRALNSWYEARVYSPKQDHFAMTVNNVTAAVEDRAKLMESIRRHEEAERQLAFGHELEKATLMSIGDGVICMDTNGQITIANDAAREIAACKDGLILGRSFDSVICLMNEYTRENLSSPMERLKADASMLHLRDNALLKTGEGREIPISYSISLIKNLDSMEGAVFVFRDETQSRRRQAEIEFLGFHDQLTGLYNRRFFELELMRAATDMELPVTVIVCDLNGLKFANDAFGHAAGDMLLTKFAEILKKNCRKKDVICRYGGDEFAVVMPYMTYAAAGKLVGRIREAIARTTFDRGILSVAFGWESMTSRDQNIYHILKKAEDHMYRNKLLEVPSIRSYAIQTVLNTLCEKSAREAKHSERVSTICCLLGKAMGLDDHEISLLKVAGRLHDIGKIIMVDGILNKPSSLSQEEWDEVRRHPEIGYRILNSTNEFSEIANSVWEHHERWDGAGYPRGVGGADICLFARIIAVVDAFDAMTTEKPYKSAISRCEAAEEIRRNAGKQFDPEVVKAFAGMDVSGL